MFTRRLLTTIAGTLATTAMAFGPPTGAQEYEPYPIEARVWLDRGEEPLLHRGERVRIYYRVSESAFVAIFHIDTDGTARVVFPNSPQENHYARGGRDYRVLFPGSSYWFVDDYPGMGYFFIVASPVPFDFSEFRYSHYDGGWDLISVGRQVYSDPYLAMDDYVATLIPDWETTPYGLDFTTYHVDERHEYPRFLCYDCHGFRPYYAWNPYHYSCSTFRLVIYNDPYYYPSTRYLGTRVVYVQPRRGLPHFTFKERAAGEPGTPRVVVRNGGRADQPGVEGAVNRRAMPRVIPPSPGSQSGARSAAPEGSNRTAAGVRGTANRRGADGATEAGRTTPGRPSQTLRRGTGGAASSVAPPRTDRTGSAVREEARRATERNRTQGTSRTVPRPTLERRVPQATKPPAQSGNRAVRPSSRLKGKGTASSSSARRGGNSSQSTSRVRSSGSSGARSSVQRPPASRANPTVRRSGASSRSSAAARGRSGGASQSSRPAVRSGTSSRTQSSVRRSGSATRSPPKVRSSSGASRSGSARSSSGAASRSRAASTRRTRRGGV